VVEWDVEAQALLPLCPYSPNDVEGVFLRSSDAGSCIDRPSEAARMAPEGLYATGEIYCGGGTSLDFWTPQLCAIAPPRIAPRHFITNSPAPGVYGEVWGVEGKGDRKPLGVCGWLTIRVVGAELRGTAVVAHGIQFGAAPPHTKVGLTPVGAMED
jgi:hypothetical protein